jgi:hypothetical protein
MLTSTSSASSSAVPMSILRQSHDRRQANTDPDAAIHELGGEGTLPKGLVFLEKRQAAAACVGAELYAAGGWALTTRGIYIHINICIYIHINICIYIHIYIHLYTYRAIRSRGLGAHHTRAHESWYSTSLMSWMYDAIRTSEVLMPSLS